MVELVSDWKAVERQEGVGRTERENQRGTVPTSWLETQ